KVQKMDLGAIFDAHIRHEFVDHDIAATMKTMAAEPYVHNVPTLTGGDGHASVVDFYTHHFVGKMPADTRIERISRTVGRDQVVDELILYFTHDCPIDYMLPGIPPTGRRVAVPHVVVMKFKGHKVATSISIGIKPVCSLRSVSSTQANWPSPEPSKPRHSWKNRGASERERPKPSDQDAQPRRAAHRARRRGDRVAHMDARLDLGRTAPRRGSA